MTSTFNSDDGLGVPSFNVSPLEKTILGLIIDFTEREKCDFLLEGDFTKIPTGSMSPALLRGGIHGLVKKGILVVQRDEDRPDYWEFTPDGADVAYNFVNKATLPSAHEAAESSVPAADRFVPIDHNAPDIEQSVEKLGKLEERIKTSNEFTVTAEERTALSKEVNVLKEALQQPTVRLAQIWSAVKSNGVLVYLSTRGSDAALNALAAEIVDHILKAFGWS